jgi:hypothetical protein
MRDYADKAIRKELLNPDNLRDVIHARVPELVGGFDFTRVQHVPTQFLLPDARSRESDLLFEIPYRVSDAEKIALVCVMIEHQTGSDPRIPLRTLIYIVLYWEKKWSEWENLPSPKPEFRLPPVLPIVFHTGTRPWGSARTIAELLGEPAAFHDFAPIWKPLFWELAEHPVDQLLSADEAFLRALAVVRVEDAELAQFEQVFADWLKRMESDRISRPDLLSFIIGWITHRRPSSDRPRLTQVAEDLIRDPNQREEVKKMFQTYADVMLEEGMRKGKREGQLEGRAIEARKIIVRQGTRKLGEPKPIEIAALDSISDLDRLERMSDRVHEEVSSWADLLSTP